MIKRYLIMVIVILAIAVPAVWFFFIRDSEPPVITLSPDIEAVSKQKGFTLWSEDKGTGILSVEVRAVQGTRKHVVLRKTYPSKPELVTEKFSLLKAPLKDGAITLEVEVMDGTTRNTALWSKVLTLDSKPPRITVKSRPPYVRQGGSSIVVYLLDEEPVSTGVMVGDLFFKGYKQANNEYYCFFAFPYYLKPGEYTPMLTATDSVGNQRENTLAVNALPRKFKNKTSKLSDAFFKKIIPEFEDTFPGITDPLEFFLKVNNELRSANRRALRKISRQTSSKMLWEGVFLRQPRSATLAGFGDHRQYMFDGKVVDEQDHLGVDLASLRNAGVMASNSGKVVFVGKMGIYGRAIIIDHGLGLHSMYAHLSEIAVDKGQPVDKAQIIGKTGATGLAYGDHLHFAIIMGGLPVTPVEWWDKGWIEDNITGRITE
ncbi:MAG: M23 family metallopeptidase [Deltaproteobacteria bacterium]|nr:M23 family metallopeptidase [Deltaproteobacteria bacterium]